MDKIICDVCGTSYPDSASQCPICGYAKPAITKSAAPEDGVQSSGGYVYVKGGRFSSSNVRKRNLDKGITPDTDPVQQDGDADKSRANTVLGVIAVVLLLALIATLIFFIVRIIGQRTESVSDPVSTSASPQHTNDPDEPISCEQLHTDRVDITLSEAGAKWMIRVTPVPADTTDKISYASMDPSIASVDAEGTVTAISPGRTSVVVKCGEASLIIAVQCTYDDGSTWSLNRTDISLFALGETWDLYSKSSTVAKNKITWTSEDTAIATIDGGIVTAVSNGITNVHAEYNGTTYSCTVRCKITEKGEDTKDEGNEDKANDPTVDASTLKLSDADGDVTLAVKTSFLLTLRDAKGTVAKVTWKASRDGFVSIDGNEITGVKSTGNDYVTVSTEYNGKTYQCIVRVK